jgi:ribosomal protein S18 acetylase RimI-like enzyme
MTEAPIRAEAIDADRFRGLAGEAASIYGAAMHRSPEVVVQRRDIIAVHVEYQGFLAAGGFIDEGDSSRLVGFGYGYDGRPGQWWHDIVAGALGRSDAARWLRDSFELAELHVSPEHQHRGLGRALMTDLLARTERSRAVLSTPDIESPARLLYRSYGFVDLRTDFRFPGNPEPYVLMGVDL